ELIEQYKIWRKKALVNPNGQAGLTKHTRRGARAHTINFELGTLKTIFNLAVKWGYLTRNPVVGVSMLKVEDAKLPRFLSKEECQRLLAACPAELYPVYFTFLNTGMRKGELINLTWEDVDLKTRKILIRPKSDWQPKTRPREIPINDGLHRLLTRLKKTKTDSPYVFPGPDGQRLTVKLREKLIRIAEQAGIADLTRVHTLRHTFASHLIMAGVDVPTVQKILGHSDIETTMLYTHLAPTHLTEAVNRISF
ncbi:MAG: site-specific integrase, partial [Candidatus Zixiibacteriota bacterium]